MRSAGPPLAVQYTKGRIQHIQAPIVQNFTRISRRRAIQVRRAVVRLGARRRRHPSQQRIIVPRATALLFSAKWDALTKPP